MAPQVGAPGAGATGTPGREGLLSMVGTPIGNLSDASRRMVDTLAASDVVLCEDTRVTARLMAHFDLHVPLLRADENVLDRRVAQVLERLAAGEHVSFVSDAGMPGVSDPGQRLVDRVRAAGFRVEVVPGPSAVTSALVASGLPMDHFFFEGFLPRKRGPQRERLRELMVVPGALVIYESPRRVADTLESIAEVFGDRRRVALVRELTKVHEEVVRGTPAQVSDVLATRGELRGECVLVVGGPGEQERAERARQVMVDQGAPQTVDEALARALAEGEPKSAAAKRVARQFGVPRAEVYERLVGLSCEDGEVGTSGA